MKKMLLISFAGVIGLSAGGWYIYNELEQFPDAPETKAVENNEDKSGAEQSDENADFSKRMTMKEYKDEQEEETKDPVDNEEQSSLPEQSEEDRVYFMEGKYFDLTLSEEENELQFQEGKAEEAAEVIAELHNSFNEIAGYGGAETLQFKEYKENEYKQIQEDASYLKEDLVAQSRLLIDLEFLYRMNQFAVHYEDRMAIRYAHRIIHDLDIHINDNGTDTSKKIWGITQAFGSKEGIQRMHRYIENQ
ncbi:hypothetical protein [Alkalicoccus daliensis]|uniref:Uncharacterized protein n=1 Tax=Alkalicoccus daliensis TaxID=745820 RepID=A0A1G9ZE65_9BACI|nr:hypothetical protein [Alkalicoccus daliensis]SDN19619.1 hypothetical protein SAMN04488053_10168 [Alkalicoccus daliensis]